MNDLEILHKYLGQRARRFVLEVRQEWLRYTYSAYRIASKGCIRRDNIRLRLERLADYRYNHRHLCQHIH